MKTVLTIAGTDPTGGAGAQADLKTFTAHSVYGMSIITALVAQNTMGVRDIMKVTPDFLKEQFDCVFEDIMPDAVKIGMVSEPDVISVVVEKLKQFEARQIVMDPVMVSTSGSRLLVEEAVLMMKEQLLPMADMITPNMKEAEVLVDGEIKNKEDMMLAAKKIATFYNGYILLKGGHLQCCADDLLYKDNICTWYHAPKIDNPNTHGTGCTLSSAIAANLAKGINMKTSVKNAKNYVNGAIKANLNIGKGRGPLNHCWDL